MKLVNKLGFLLCACFFQTAQAGGWQATTTVSNMIIEGDSSGNRIYVSLASNPNPDLCTAGGGYLRVYGDTQKGKYLITMITLAIDGAKSIAPLVSGCDDWNRPILHGILKSE